jgi:transposase
MPGRTPLRPVSEAERGDLERLVRSNPDARILRRAQIIRLRLLGHKHGEIAELLGVSPPTVAAAIRRFNEGGIAGLADRPRSGRPPRVTESYIEALKGAVRTAPTEWGYEFSTWSLGRLREHLGRETGIWITEVHLWRLMGKHGLVYRRPRHDLSHLRDPAEYEQKKGMLDLLKKGPRRRKPTSS